ncbi:Hopanoid C-3 methylase [archaeon HR06]|nr:Hopanoid C-3 methylase [archaeon HR06]
MDKIDLLLIHPPAFFKRDIIFPGPIAETVQEVTDQFLAFPIGFISIADFLYKRGFNVKILNLGELKSLDLFKFFSNLKADYIGIGLHWCIHSKGAIDLAKFIKEINPNFKIILGGLTSTRFHYEIIKEFDFIDGIIRGEAEEVLLDLLKRKSFEDVPNLTYRSGDKIKVNPMRPNISNLDDLNFTNLDLIMFKDKIKSSIGKWVWNIPISRGCVYNCKHCGGSSYSYKSLFNRNKPAFRSPEKIIEDIIDLKERGIKRILLFQDPRIAGRNYWEKLLKLLTKLNIDSLTLELFYPANEEYIDLISKINFEVTLTISPESGSERIRFPHGRVYSNSALLKCVEICGEKGVKLTPFFMTGLGEEDEESRRETRALCEEICRINTKYLKIREWFNPVFGPMILLDPGSLAFDYPELYGYKLIFKNFKDYYEGLSLPSWHQWISYETKNYSRRDLAKNMLEDLEFVLDLKERYATDSSVEGYLLDQEYLNLERYNLYCYKIVAEELENCDLNSLMEAYKNRFNEKILPKLKYGEKFLEAFDRSIGLIA